MARNSLDKHRIVWAEHGFKNLLGWLLVYLVVGPFLERVPYAHTLVGLFLTAVLFSAIYAVNKEARVLSLAIGLLVLTLILMWLGRLGILSWSPVFYTSLMILYLGTLVYSFLRHLVAIRRVDSNVICAALCTYLMLGLLWGGLFQVLETLSPGSFAGGLLDAASSPHETEHYLNYFSFVTLSTLGYGDITPQTQGATALCEAEAILGQFFIVVLVARLVGIQIAQESTGEN